MARAGIKNTRMLLVKPLISIQGLAKPNIRQYTDKALRDRPVAPAEAAGGRKKGDDPASSCWMPHPRSGIYFPQGQEWVMDDIPSDAARFNSTVWLRSIDGVDDKPDPDVFTHHYPY